MKKDFTKNISIRELVDNYEIYLKSLNLNKKDYKKSIEKFKIDLVDNYYNKNFFIVSNYIIEEELKSGKLIVERHELDNYIHCRDTGKSASLSVKVL